ncbi:hypothetical protein [Priestia megaterium]|uniref:hypothetical protein n=1 Tax=Priestia megaterium TaxID=1404 RepID=UPI00244829BE|nr:hypothetical protein [Priestia megaterium]MDH2363788.1 hypothetical protein [Priestia megaterium]
MKKILALISVISIVGVLASCGKEEANTEPKPKTCEQIEPCKTALKYATYYNQGAKDKVYDMELEGENNKSYTSKEEAIGAIEDKHQKLKDKKIKKYAALEYEVSPGETYIYKFEFPDLITGEKTEMKMKIEKTDNNSFGVSQYYVPVPNSDITVAGKIVDYKTYYSKGLTKKEKEELTPLPIEE